MCLCAIAILYIFIPVFYFLINFCNRCEQVGGYGRCRADHPRAAVAPRRYGHRASPAGGRPTIPTDPVPHQSRRPAGVVAVVSQYICIFICLFMLIFKYICRGFHLIPNWN